MTWPPGTKAGVNPHPHPPIPSLPIPGELYEFTFLQDDPSLPIPTSVLPFFFLSFPLLSHTFFFSFLFCFAIHDSFLLEYGGGMNSEKWQHALGKSNYIINFKVSLFSLQLINLKQTKNNNRQVAKQVYKMQK